MLFQSFNQARRWGGLPHRSVARALGHHLKQGRGQVALQELHGLGFSYFPNFLEKPLINFFLTFTSCSKHLTEYGDRNQQNNGHIDEGRREDKEESHNEEEYLECARKRNHKSCRFISKWFVRCLKMFFSCHINCPLCNWRYECHVSMLTRLHAVFF